jgi:hypothetical protein
MVHGTDGVTRSDSAIRAALVQEPCEGSPVWS